jgi:hypothetical protein
LKLLIERPLAITPDQRRTFMDTLQKYTFKDIERAISVSANYLAALGLSTYTENLGGLYCGNLQVGVTNNYISFIRDYFPPSYMTVHGQLQLLHKDGLYKVVRSGLVHEYFMKVHSTVNIGSANPLTCGIVYDTSNKPHLEFNVNQYFSDYKDAFKKYYDSLLGNTSKAPDKTLETKFDNAINGMMKSPFDQSLFPSLGLTRASGSSSTITTSSKASEQL